MGALGIKESVVLPLPKHIDVIRHAALLYTEQYQVAVRIQIRGQVMLHDNTICLIPNWVSIAQFDSELDLLGLGDPDMTEDDENLLWVAPLDGEFRLSELDSGG
ncbi:hypothetical protein [Ktedonobacter racemifer]|nr:hypothetical protein [Ktedonobacter racemifer]